MVIIGSSDNRNFKLCQQLANKKHRDKMGLYLIEGPNLLAEAVANGARIQLVVFSENKVPELSLENLGESYKGAEVVGMTAKLFEKIGQTETSQGVLAVIEKQKTTQEQASLELLSGDGNVVILDRLQDPGNIGTIIRTADAAGYKGVMVLKGTGDVYAPKVIRAAAGSVFRMPVLFVESPAQAIELLKRYGKMIVATCFDTEHAYYDSDLKKHVALVIGNEGNGICPEFINGADLKVKIPMAGRTESLNAAVAAGIIMFEAIRK